MADDTEDKIVDLEIRIAYQDRKVDELDALVRAFAARLETAERELKELKQSVTPQEHQNERPPHY
jgi:uncharacterized coiled-coil protein SlyX